MKFLSLLVFTAGAATLGVELSAARLLDPWFGNSQIVWAGLIGLILLYLAVGAWLGGRLADRFPTLDGLLALTSLAGLGVALIPTISPPILRLAALGLNSYAPGLLAGTLLAVLLIFSLPVILLGAVSPWAVRLAVADLKETGRTAGRLYAIATLGSIVGTFLPVLWLIPAYGTRWSFYLLALGLLAVCALGTLLSPRKGGRVGWLPVAALLLVILLLLLGNPSAVRARWDDATDGTLLYEDESLYNYIAVRAWGNERHLKLNEGVGIHSVYHPDTLLSNGIWDYFLLAPLFQKGSGEWGVGSESQRVLVIGLAGGTVPALYTDVYGPWPITGVELDPQIMEIGQRFFGMDQPNLTQIAGDGRRWLAQQPADIRFDLILVDAYRPPYIPFHLTTVEFFSLVASHLSQEGVVAVNVGRTSSNYALVDALSQTLGAIFPAVFVIDEPGPADDLGNSLVVATGQPLALDDFLANVARLPDSLPAEFRAFAREAAPRARPATGYGSYSSEICRGLGGAEGDPAQFPAILPHPNPYPDDCELYLPATPPADRPIFTDDHAPVEQLVHSIIWDFLQGER